MKIIIDANIPFIKGLFEPYSEVNYLPGSSISRSDIENSDALIIRTRTKCTSKLLSGTGIKIIGTTTIGTDHIDTQWCGENGIRWVSAPGSNSGSVMQYITAGIFHLLEKFQLKPEKLTLGIIGVGNVGSKVAKMAAAIGMNVLLNDPPRERVEGSSQFVSFDHLVKESDIITLHVPLTRKGEDATVNMVDRVFLEKMKSGSHLINTSRGEIVVESDIIETKRGGMMKSLILDVWRDEPSINHELLQLCEIGTPHIAGYSKDGKSNSASTIVNSFARFFNLPISGWKPDNLPEPAVSLINTGDYSGSLVEKINRVISHTYPIIEDSDSLKQNPDRFEKLRNDYWSRREFGSYTVAGDDEILRIARDLGFKTIR